MKNKEKWLVWGGFAVLVYGLLIVTGTLFSGIHCVDDHEFIRYVMHMEEKGIWDCIISEIRIDLDTRFRPMYYFIRICLVAVIGYNFILWGILTGGVIVIALAMAYFSARKLGCSSFYSIIFSLIIMVGPQSVVWWKFGPQESIGMAMLTSGIWCLLCWIQTDKNYYGVIGGLVFTILSLYKESFICLLPLAVAMVFIEYCRQNEYSIQAILSGIKKYWLFTSILTVVGIVEVCMIVFYVGTNETGYVGLNTDIGLYEYTVIWMDCFKGPLKWFVLFGIIMIAVMLTRLNRWKEWLSGAIVTMVIMLPQVFVYNMTGLNERYILPWSLGYAWFLIITAVRGNGVLEGAKVRKNILNICLIGLLICHFTVFWKEAQHHTYRGTNFQKVWKIVEENTSEESNILAAFTYAEANITVTLWGAVNNRKNVYTWKEEPAIAVRTTMGGLDEGTDPTPLEEMDVIMWYSPEHRHYGYDPKLDLSDYSVQQIGTLVVAVREENK